MKELAVFTLIIDLILLAGLLVSMSIFLLSRTETIKMTAGIIGFSLWMGMVTDTMLMVTFALLAYW